MIWRERRQARASSHTCGRSTLPEALTLRFTGVGDDPLERGAYLTNAD